MGFLGGEYALATKLGSHIAWLLTHAHPSGAHEEVITIKRVTGYDDDDKILEGVNTFPLKPGFLLSFGWGGRVGICDQP